MRLIFRLYYAFNRWRYGVSYGCGRCHHGHTYHLTGREGVCRHCTVVGCPCQEYSIERVNI
jgi:hypothetical protein